MTSRVIERRRRDQRSSFISQLRGGVRSRRKADAANFDANVNVGGVSDEDGSQLGDCCLAGFW